MLKKTIMVVVGLLFFVNTVLGVVVYPNVEFYDGNLTVGFSNPNGINTTYLEVNRSYIQLTDYNLSLTYSNTLEINISEYNHVDSLDAVNNTLLRFNVTHSSGNVVFSFTNGNATGNFIYYLYRDAVAISTHTTNSFTFSYNSWSTHDFEIEGLLYPDPPYNASSSYNATNNSVNLTWSTGNYSDANVLVKNTGHYPATPSDGTVIKNGTGEFYHFNVTETAYYTVWSFNSSFNTFSLTGLNLPWGALTLNVKNASKTWQTVSPFGVIIQNTLGTEIYVNYTANSPLNIDFTDIPVGSNTVFIINATGYKTQTYRRDTSLNTFLNYTFLLPPLWTYTPGQGDDDPVTGDPTNETDSQLYLITLLNEVDQAIVDGLCEFKLYDNFTDTYQQVGSFLTDGAGQGTIWLVPNKLYQVVCSVPGSNDYQVNTSYWTPSNILFTKTFKLKYAEEDIQEPYLPHEYITFTATRTNTSMTITYNDALTCTINTTIYVYEINKTTGIESLFHTNTTEDTDSFTFTVSGLDAETSYRVVLHYSHSIFGDQDPFIILPGWRTELTSPATLNTMMTDIFGYNPLVWTHCIMFIILVIGMFAADSEDAGKLMIILGGIFIFLNVFVALDDALVAAAGGIIPGLFILLGIIIEWNNRKK